MFAFGLPLSRGHAALRGALAAVLGIVFLIWPGITVGVAVALFAIYCFADAISNVVELFRAEESTGHRMLLVLIAVVDVAAGVVAVAYPSITAEALVVVIGVWAIVTGSMELAGAWQLRGAHSGTGWLTVAGLMSIVVGILLIASPGIGAVSLALIFAIYLFAYGATMLVAAAMTPKAHDVGDVFA
jgi:uncharacterized membrane protein HdeD (DUF308 family)